MTTNYTLVATALLLLLETSCATTRTATPESSAAPAAQPKFAAKVPSSITTPDVVMTEKLGELRFFDGMPSKETVRKVLDQLDFSRGVETFLTGIPAASIYAMLEGIKEAGVAPNGLGITEQLLDARSLLLTPNTTVVYMLAEINVKDGPIVVEAPPAMLGLVDNAFMEYVVDIGFVGPDKGKGGKYLFTPPGYEGKTPKGYFVVPTNTYRNWLASRAFPGDAGLEATVAGIKDGFRMYPLSEARNPPEQQFVNLSGQQFNTIHANDFEFFEELDAIVQYEPADAFNRELVGLWASIGIKKGKPFAPDARMKKILEDAAAVANATARALSFPPRARHAFFYDDRQWHSPFAGGSHEFMNDGELVLDDRTFFHYVATGITPAMAQSAVGQGSAYGLTSTDSDGNNLDGGNTYKVTLPAPVPANNFWAFTVYSGQHRSLLETDQKTAGLDSNNPSVKPNEDGSYTIWFGPEPPEGHEGNWIQTMPGKSWNTILRLYGPLEPWFDKTWKPGDIELVKP